MLEFFSISQKRDDDGKTLHVNSFYRDNTVDTNTTSIHGKIQWNKIKAYCFFIVLENLMN